MKINKDYFRRINIEITNYCNLKCPGCFRNHVCNPELNSKNMDLETFKNIINNFKNLEEVAFVGNFGEPSLNPFILEFVKFVKSKNLFLEIFTNMSYLNENLWYNIGQELEEKDRVTITINGITQKTHEKYRKGSKLEIIHKNLNQLRRNNLKNEYINLIDFNYNKTENDMITKLNKYYSVGRGSPDPIFHTSLKTQEEYESLLPEIFKIYKREVLDHLNDNRKIRCRVEKDKEISVNVFGEYFLCEFGQLEGLNPLEFPFEFEKEFKEVCKFCNGFMQEFCKKNNLTLMC